MKELLLVVSPRNSDDHDEVRPLQLHPKAVLEESCLRGAGYLPDDPRLQGWPERLHTLGCKAVLEGIGNDRSDKHGHRMCSCQYDLCTRAQVEEVLEATVPDDGCC